MFADLGLPDAEELLVKSQLAVSITERIEQNTLGEKLAGTNSRSDEFIGPHDR